jgi:hypothetical protein
MVLSDLFVYREVEEDACNLNYPKFTPVSTRLCPVCGVTAEHILAAYLSRSSMY